MILFEHTRETICIRTLLFSNSFAGMSSPRTNNSLLIESLFNFRSAFVCIAERPKQEVFSGDALVGTDRRVGGENDRKLELSIGAWCWFDAGTYIRVCSVRGLILMSKTEKFRPKFETESTSTERLRTEDRLKFCCIPTILVALHIHTTSTASLFKRKP